MKHVYVSKDPKALVSLSRLSDVLDEFFDLDDSPISRDTPFVWWNRSKGNYGISLPMPEPAAFSGADRRGPLWPQDQILHWYGQWQEVTVPKCPEAGDRASSGGRYTLSEYRST